MYVSRQSRDRTTRKLAPALETTDPSVALLFRRPRLGCNSFPYRLLAALYGSNFWVFVPLVLMRSAYTYICRPTYGYHPIMANHSILLLFYNIILSTRGDVMGVSLFRQNGNQENGYGVQGLSTVRPQSVHVRPCPPLHVSDLPA
jgi:hypothetical protein